MSDLATMLKTPPIEESSRARDEYDFSAEVDPVDSNRRDIKLTTASRLENENDWTKAVEDMGSIPIPEGYRVRLVEMRHNTHGWTRKAQGQDATTTGTWFYRFAVEPAGMRANLDDIMRSIDKRKPSKVVKSTGDGVYHLFSGDTQLGKDDGDGSEGIVNSVVRSLETALDDFKDRRKRESLGIVNLAWVGDCIEGNQSQKGKNFWRTGLTITEQIRVFRRLMLYGIDLFAPYAEKIEVDVVNGNHDRVQDFQTTRPDDGHATEAAISLSDALELNPAVYGHVSVFVPPTDSAFMTRQIGSSRFTFTHGHQWRRGKAWDWWAGQALNFQNAGAADFLVHGHFHTAAVDTKRERTIFSVPTHEDESGYWKELTGDLARRGSFGVVTRDGEFSGLRII